MTRKQATKIALAHNSSVKEWDSVVQTAAENGLFMTTLSVSKKPDEHNLFETWLKFNDFKDVRDITLPQHHTYLYEVHWV